MESLTAFRVVRDSKLVRLFGYFSSSGPAAIRARLTRKQGGAAMKICFSICLALLSVCSVESLVDVDRNTALLRGSRPSSIKAGSLLRSNPMAAHSFGEHLVPLRGGAGIAKKLGAKNLGLLMVLLSILYAPSAMSSCTARIIPQKDGSRKIQRMGCGALFMVNNIATLVGLALVLVNSRKFDRYGRSKFKMRLTGSLIIFMGMMLVIAHAGTPATSNYSICFITHDYKTSFIQKLQKSTGTPEPMPTLALFSNGGALRLSSTISRRNLSLRYQEAFRCQSLYII
jgi:hypothetical protein